jgi:hypothetical protein
MVMMKPLIHLLMSKQSCVVCVYSIVNCLNNCNYFDEYR